jgi:5-methylcytosine-specific restriction endonuclease McrA
MSNKWGIPKEVEKLVLERDTHCVYCGVDFSIEHISRKTKPSWEHIINDIRINGSDNIALCCMSCNASKGAKLLQDWLKTNYCKNKRITSNSVSQVVKNTLLNLPGLVKPK